MVRRKRGIENGINGTESADNSVVESAADAGTAEAAAATDTPAFTDPGTAGGAFADTIAGTEAPADTGTFTTAGPVKRGRGRPRGSTNSPKQGAINISGVETLLLGIHTSLRFATGIEEFELDANEAKKIAEAWANVAQYYPALNLDPRVAAIANLGSVLAITYGTRIINYRMRTGLDKAARRAKPIIQGTPETSAPMPPAPNFSEPVNGQKSPSGPREVPVELRRGEIPGIGVVEFPADDPLFGGRKH